VGVKRGIIGETYQVNFTHAAYCSTGKVVPYTWAYKAVPSGVGQFLVLTGATASIPSFASAPDTKLYSPIGNLPHMTMGAATGITFFGCE